MCFGVFAVEVVVFPGCPLVFNMIYMIASFQMVKGTLLLVPMYAVLASGVRFGRVLLATRTEQSKKPNGAPKKYPKTNNCQPAILILLPFTVAAKVVVTNFHSRRRTNQKTVNDLCTCFVYTILTPNYGDSIV